MEKMYDYLIVGAGLYGSIFAYEAKKKGKKCFVIDKRNHIGGNIYTENIDGINVHKYGAHIFHTSNEKIWEYVNSIVKFNRFINTPIANYKGELYNLPFNMNTFYKLWGVTTPIDAKNKIQEQILEYKHIKKPQNLEEQALILVGKDIYEKLIKGYTEKQWGRPANTLPAFIIRRLPLRFTFDNNYFNDIHQGIPIGGYTNLIKSLLKDIDIKLNENYFDNKIIFDKLAKKIIFTGKIDEYFDYKFGKLEYRSLYFQHKKIDCTNFQGNAVVNYTDSEIPYTRIIEHKHFEFGEQNKSIITYEYPCDYKEDNEPYYPINDENNQKLYKKYKELADNTQNVHFGGRLGDYKYYDMHHIVQEVLEYTEKEFSK